MQSREDLYLEIVINGAPTGKLAAIRRYANGCLAMSSKDRKVFGIRMSSTVAAPDGDACLNSIPGAATRYSEANQTLYLTLPDQARDTVDIDAAPAVAKPAPLLEEHDFSAIFNFSVFSGFDWDGQDISPHYQSSSLSIDAHVFSPYGAIDQSAIIRSGGAFTGADVLRIQSRWSYDNPSSLVTVAAGDIISGSLNWTRSLRMGGVQVRKDFGLRPDLVTLPVPQLSGSAAVPSTVEVYANQSRLLSQDVNGGPFRISNIPVATGPGTMKLVLRDAAGKETVTEYAYYNSSQLLSPGLFDYSIETGVARRFFGLTSNDYDQNPIGSTSFRYGLTPRLTLEGHGEGGAGLVNGGAGLAFGLNQYGVASVSASASGDAGRMGAQVSASFETSFWGARFFARMVRSLGDYEDLAAVTEPKRGSAASLLFDGKPYKSQDQFSLSKPVPFTSGSINLNYSAAKEESGRKYRTVSAGYAQPFLWKNSTVSVNGFSDLADRANYGVFASIGFADEKTSALATVDSGPGGFTAGGSVSQPVGSAPDSFGYNVTTSQGAVSTSAATVSYRGTAMQVSGGIEQVGKTAHLTAQADGAVAIMNGVYFANRIDNAFAVVETGLPGVDIQRENRLAGKTGDDGKVFISDMIAREPNVIAIDPMSLSPGADVAELKQIVVPPARGGISVHFKTNPAPSAALVSFVDEHGVPLPPGSEVIVNGGAEPFTMGYDGEAYLTGLMAVNAARVKKPDDTLCAAGFKFSAVAGSQVRISNVMCAMTNAKSDASAMMGKS